MPYLLDTNVVIRQLNGTSEARALVGTLAPHGIAVSTIVLMEVWQAVYRAIDPRTLEAEYQDFFDSIVVIPFDAAVAKRCARLRHDLKQRGIRTRARALDLQIAATALHHGLELVTYNQRDYDDIPALVLYRG